MAPSSIEFNPLVVIAGAAVLCAIISFIVARRNIRARPVFAQDARGGEEKPPLADVYIEPMRGLGWKEMMPVSVSTPYDTAIATNTTSRMEIAVTIMMPSPVKQQNESSIQDHDHSRRMSSLSSTSSVKKKMPEEWAEDTERESNERLDYSIGLIEIPCYHRKALEFG